MKMTAEYTKKLFDTVNIRGIENQIRNHLFMCATGEEYVKQTNTPPANKKPSVQRKI